VSPAIARRSGRAFVPLTELVDPSEVDVLREEARRLGTSGVLDLAAQHLAEVAAGGD
jgi:hypothetical protein